MKQITINADSEDYVFTLEQDMIVNNVCLSFARIPNTYYNLRTSMMFTFSDGLGTFANLNAGQYSITELCDTIQNAIQVFDANYSCVFDEVQMRVIIQNTTPVNFQLNFLTNGWQELAGLLGFQYIDYGPADYRIAESVPQMVKSEYLIQIPEIGLTGIGDSIYKKYTFIVPVTGLRGDFTDFYENEQFRQQSYDGQKILNILHLRLLRPDGFLYDLNGASWQVILTVR